MPIRNNNSPIAPPTSTGSNPLVIDAEDSEYEFDDSLAPSGSSYDAIANQVRIPRPIGAVSSIPSSGLALNVAGLTISANGTLKLADASKGFAGELEAITFAARQPTNPFAAATDANALEAVVTRLQQLVGILRRSTLPFAPDFLQARAAVMGLTQHVAERAHALGAAELHQGAVIALLSMLDGEPEPALKSFQAASALRAFNQGALPAFAGRAKEMDQRTPPYEKWKKDGVTRIHMVIDNNGTELSGLKSFLKEQGFKKATTDGQGNTTYVRAARAGGLPTELILAAPEEDGEPAIFGTMDREDIDIVLYSGHAGYGQNVRDAISSGVSGNGAGKLIVLFQCSGIHNADDVNRAFPMAQFLSTTEMTDDGLDFTMFEEMLKGIDRSATWSDIHRDVQVALKGLQRPEDLSRHYFYPGQAELSELDTDRDQDGISDAKDSTFNATIKVSAKGLMFEPQVNRIALRHLNGAALGEACGNLALVLRNSHMLTETQEREGAWRALLSAGGFYEPAEGDHRAFRFQYNPGSRTIEVALSSHFAHANAIALSQMMAVEAASFFRDHLSLDAQTHTALALSLLERVKHQTRDRYEFEELDEQTFSLMMQRYGMSPGEAEVAIAATKDAEDFERSTFLAVYEATKNMKVSAPRAISRTIVSPDGELPRVSDIADARPSDFATALKLPGALKPLSGFNGESDYDSDAALAERRFIWTHDNITELLVIVAEGNTLVGGQAFAFDFETTFLNKLSALSEKHRFGDELVAGYGAAIEAGLPPQTALDGILKKVLVARMMDEINPSKKLPPESGQLADDVHEAFIDAASQAIVDAFELVRSSGTILWQELGRGMQKSDQETFFLKLVESDASARGDVLLSELARPNSLPKRSSESKIKFAERAYLLLSDLDSIQANQNQPTARITAMTTATGLSRIEIFIGALSSKYPIKSKYEELVATAQTHGGNFAKAAAEVMADEGLEADAYLDFYDILTTEEITKVREYLSKIS